jgi:ribosomal protein L11 methyltransferase
VEVSPETEQGSLISAFFPLETAKEEAQYKQSIHEKLLELFGLYEQAMPDLLSEIIDDQDWATSWKQFFTPVEIVPGLVIKPSWEEYHPEHNEKIIEMDPGQAFGTGQHESTKMALSLLTTALTGTPAAGAGRVLDVGTGTGILAMAAVLFGTDSAVAIDNDPEAVRVAGENIKTNNLEKQITTSITPLTEIEGRFPLILANIVHDVLVEMAPRFAELIEPQGRVILAGILAGEQEKNIIKVYQKLGFQCQESLHDGEWAALLFHAS